MDEATRTALARGPVFLLFYLLLLVVTPVLIAVSLAGWAFLLVRGAIPEEITRLGASLADWYARTTRYLTGGASRRPFPFEDLDCPRDEPGPAPSKRADTVAPRPAADGQADDDQAHRQVDAGTDSASFRGDKKVTERKAAKKKAAAKSATTKKSAGKKSTGRKSTGKKVAGKKTVAKRSGAKMTTRRSVGDEEQVTEADSALSDTGETT